MQIRFAVTSVTGVLWYAWNIGMFFVWDPVTRWTDTSVFALLDRYLPFPLWLYVGLWFFFLNVNYIISRQIMMVLFTYASVVSVALAALNDEIQKFPKEIRKCGEVLDELEAKLPSWKCQYARCARLCDAINDHFNGILFVVYGCDFLAMLSCCTNLFINVYSIGLAHYFYGLSAVMFCLDLTVFLVHLVVTNEKVSIDGSLNLNWSWKYKVNTVGRDPYMINAIYRGALVHACRFVSHRHTQVPGANLLSGRN